MLPYPALHASHSGVWIATRDGTREVSRGEAIALVADTPTIVLNAPLIGQRLGYAELSGLDLLELFAFVHPARFAVPTPKGIAQALDLPLPADEAGIADLLRRAAAALIATASAPWAEQEGAWTAARSLFRLRWPWAPALGQVLPKPDTAERWLFSKLPEWEEAPPRAHPRTVTLAPDAVAERLASLTGSAA